MTKCGWNQCIYERKSVFHLKSLRFCDKRSLAQRGFELKLVGQLITKNSNTAAPQCARMVLYENGQF